MSRLLLTVLAALIIGIAAWSIVGFTAAQIFTKLGNDREGSGSMQGFFYIGGLGGIIGALVGAWLVWRLLADPSRMGMVGAGMGGLVLLLAIGWGFAMRSPYEAASEFPKGAHGELQVELKFPAGQIADLTKQNLSFEVRAYQQPLLTSRWQPAHQDGNEAVEPIAFPIDKSDSWNFAIMNGAKQLGVASLGDNLVHDFSESAPWSAWAAVTATPFEVRWRIAVSSSIPHKDSSALLR